MPDADVNVADEGSPVLQPRRSIGSRPFRFQGLLAAGLFVLIFLVAVVLYRGSMYNEFVWDDPIVLGQQLQAFHSIGEIFFPPPRIPQFGGLYYRPMILVSYMLDRSLWGDTPFGFHFPVVIMHALNSALIFLLGRRLFGVRTGALWAALAAALLFATHPIHTESVCWMAGRSDTLATLFLVPAFLCYLRWKQDRGRWWWIAISAALFLGGCFSKETAASFLLIIVAADLMRIGEPGVEEAGAMPMRSAAVPAAPSDGGRPSQGGKSGKGKKDGRRGANRPRGPQKSRQPRPGTLPVGGWLAGWAAYGAAFCVYWMFRMKALERYPEKLRPTEAGDPLLNVLRAVGFYIGKIVVPTHLDAYIPNIPSPGPALGIGICALLIGALLICVLWARGWRMMAFLIAFFFGGLAPSLAIAWFQISEAPVAERYLYIPSIGFCLLLGYLGFVALPSLLAQLGGSQATTGADEGAIAPGPGAGAVRVVLVSAGVATLALTAVYASLTLDREKDWKADLAFWTDGVEKSPNEGLPHLHLGLANANLGRADEAERQYKLAIDPTVEYDVEGRSTALNNLGMLYMGKSNFVKADDYFEQAIKMRPDYPTPYYGIGVTTLRRAEVLGKAGQVDDATQAFDKSEAYFRHAIELNPQYVKAHNQLGYLYAQTGRTEPALVELNRVLQLVRHGPDYDFAVNLKSQIEARGGR